MTRVQRRKRFDLWLFVKKSALSGFVVLTFIAYVIDQRLAAAKQALTNQPPTPIPSDPAQAGSTTVTSAQSGLNPPYYSMPQSGGQAYTPPTSAPQAQAQPTQAPTAQPQQVAQGQYKDGSYNGPVTDAFYGQMQVEAVIQGGKLTQVQILQYPHDRRTSQMINSQALPWLESEAVQAQSANINMISGATLSSNAFIESLQSALSSARG